MLNIVHFQLKTWKWEVLMGALGEKIAVKYLHDHALLSKRYVSKSDKNYISQQLLRLF